MSCFNFGDVNGPCDSILECPPECTVHSNKPGPGQRPRPVVIRLHRFQQKDKIIREAIAKRGKLLYRYLNG
ncbi:hypothetical protein F7725_009460 [Dissostichus mawsoni]|uniref:Uncharacterized protein n=1 Tax=Dissostichus mawsoni TaxID=36200 RepID=A0A7J5XKT3_DISMA|nr:hypothetical protein F7725_009460 [Dissostichus mawsoni]